MIRSTPILLILLLLGIGGFASLALGQETQPSQDTEEKKPIISEEVVVSATKIPQDSIDIPSSTAVVTGEEIKRSGAKTVAEAIQDIVGITTGNASDNGPWLPNIGMWGLQEFDALLVMVDGVPAGGPFNPNLSEINVDNVDRIEIVKGPQGNSIWSLRFCGNDSGLH